MRLLICLAFLAVAINASVIYRRETQTDIGAKINEDLKNVLAEIEKAADQGKTVAHDLLTKGHALLDQAKTLGGQAWHAAQGELAKLNGAASTVFSDFLKNFGGIWQEIQHLLGKRSVERRFLLDDLKAFNARLSKDMQSLFHDVSGKLTHFNSYLHTLFNKEVDAAKPVIDNVKQLAQNFLNATQVKSKDVLHQAQTFFQPYKHDLGELWTEIECEYNHIAHAGPACATTSKRATETEIGAKVQADLKNVLAEIEKAADQGKTVAHELLTKGHALLDQAKTLGGQVWHAAQGELTKLNGAASTVFSDFLKNFGGIWQEIQHLLGKRSVERRFLLDDLKAFNARLSKDMQSLFHDVSGKLTHFNSYLHTLFNKEVDAAKPVIDNVKQLAQNFLNATEVKSKDVLHQAQTFFQPYKHDLGELWTEIECEYNHIAHAGPACATTSKRATETEIGAKVQADLKNVLAEIEKAADQGKTVAHELLTKGHALLDQAKTLGGQVWHAAQGELTKLNGAASTVFSDFLKNFGGIWQEIQHLLGKRSVERRFLLDDLKAFNARLSKDMQSLFHDVSGKLTHFNSYLHTLFNKEVDAAKPVIDNVKQLAQNFLNATEVKSKDVLHQAQTFFQPYKHDLGELWTEIECEYNHIAHAGPACATTSKRATETDIGAKVQADLINVLAEIEKAADQGKTVAHELLTKGHALLDQAKTLGGQVWHAAQGELTKLNGAASTVFSDFLKNFGGIWQEIQHLLGKRSVERRFLLDDLKAFNARLSKDMQSLFHDVSGKLTHFNSYLHTLFNKEVDAAKPVIDNVKQLAQNFLNATEVKSKDVLHQAQTFFQPYKHDLGELWTEIECEYNHIAHAGPACATTSKRATETEIGAKVQADLKNVLAEIEKAADQGKTVAHELLTKGHALLDQAKTLGGQVWHAAQGELTKLNGAASTVFSDFLKNFGGIWQEIQHLLGKRSVERRFLLDDLKAFNARLSKDMQSLFHDVSGKLTHFNSYLHTLFNKEVDAAKPVIDNVKQLAQNFLNATEVKSKDVLHQAQTFFQPYKHDLGELWTEIECEYNHIAHAGPACATTSKRATETDIGAKVQADLINVLAEIEKAADQGKTVAHELLTKGHALLDQAKTLGGQVWHAAQGELTKLNGAASTVFSDFLKNFGGIWQEIQHLLGKRSVERRFLLDDLKAFNARLSKDMQSLFHDVSGKLTHFNSYLHTLFNKEVDAAKPVIDNVKQLAQNFLNATEVKSKDVLHQAQTFFLPYKHDLGELWTEIECEYNHIAHAGPACATTSKRATETDIGAKVQADLKNVLAEIEKAADQGKTVAHELLTKGHALLDQAKTLGGQVWQAAQGELTKLNGAASTVFSDFLKNFGGIWQEIQHLLGKREIQTGVGAQIEAQLKDVLKQIETTVDSGKEVAHDLLEKGHTLLSQAKVTGGQVWVNAKAELSQLKGQASTVFSTFLESVSNFWHEIMHAFGKREVQTGVGAQVEAELKDVLKQIETTVDSGKAVAHDLLEKGHTLLSQAKVAGGQVWVTAKAELSKLKGQASTVFSTFLKSASNFWHEIAHVFGRREAEVDKRFLFDSLQALSTHLGDDLKKIFSNVGSKFTAFNQYLVDFFNKQVQATKPVVDNVKQLATNFLSATKQKTKEVVSQAKTFFEPYKHDLGELWGEIECSYNHIVNNAGTECHTPATN